MRTAESVSPMHPDKICDRISDSILDECLRQDPDARVAIEVLGGHGIITICGEVTMNDTCFVDYRKVAQSVLGEKKYDMLVQAVEQSPEIANGVDTGGAGDQGIMVGYATNLTENYMPLEVILARDLNQTIYAKHPYDGKTQVTLNDDNQIMTIVCSWQNVPHDELKALVKDWAVDKRQIEDVNYHINPAGDWSVGGFDADTGLTGRKLAVDNYGPTIPIGGGAFSGKDPSKVDRSGAYMARALAVRMLQLQNADEVTVRLAYAIGYKYPVEATATSIKNGETTVLDILSMEAIDLDNLTPNGIIESLNLKRPIYAETAEYGHFGRGFAWDS